MCPEGIEEVAMILFKEMMVHKFGWSDFWIGQQETASKLEELSEDAISVMAKVVKPKKGLPEGVLTTALLELHDVFAADRMIRKRKADELARQPIAETSAGEESGKNDAQSKPAAADKDLKPRREEDGARAADSETQTFEPGTKVVLNSKCKPLKYRGYQAEVVSMMGADNQRVKLKMLDGPEKNNKHTFPTEQASLVAAALARPAGVDTDGKAQQAKGESNVEAEQAKQLYGNIAGL